MEIEAKFTIHDRDTYTQLIHLESLHGLQLTAGLRQEFQDTYLDTKKLKLFKRGYALRKREAADRALLTLKTIGSEPSDNIHHREEVETPIAPGASPEEWPAGPVLAAVQKLIGKSSLTPLVRLAQTRLIRHLLDGSRKIAEISLDEVKISGHDEQGPILELEIELLEGGSEAELAEISGHFQSDWDLQPQQQSKFARALQLSGRPITRIDPPPTKVPKVHKKPKKKPGINREDSMATAARKTLGLHFKWMLYHEPGTRAGEDIEELHDMRVATRRMRAALPIFREFLAPEKVKLLEKGLRRTGRTLGAVRDLDVFWEKTEEYLEARLPGEAADLSALRVVWEQERRKSRQKMLKYLDSRAYRKFKIRFQAFLDDPANWTPPAPRAQKEPVPHHLNLVVPVVVYQRLGDVLAYQEWLAAPDVPLAHYHQLRIAAKRLRYTLEYFQEVLGPEVHMLIERIKGLQDHLGDLQDCVIAQEILTDFLNWGVWKPTEQEQVAEPHQPTLFRDPGVTGYLRAREREMRVLMESFPHVWHEITDPYFTHSIAAMLSVW